MPATVALPTHAWNPGFSRAFASITRQHYGDLDILVLLDGVSPADRTSILDTVRVDARVRVIELPRCGLAATLNVALEAARHELIARMDDDDESLPTRIGDQAAFMSRNPQVAALGAAWEVIERDGRQRCTVRPPTHPGDLRWKLLLGNCLAHGSMMLRRSAIRWFGGYDPRLDKAQDYDLWFRISRVPGALAALPQVLYRHFLRDATEAWCTSEEQARITARLMLRAWRDLASPCGAEPPRHELEAALVSVLTSPKGKERGEIERSMRAHGPSFEGLVAWLWSGWLTPPGEKKAAEVCRRARVREVGAALRREGVGELWLWGAGEHTRRLLEHPEDLGVPVVGVLDDARAGEEAFGLRVVAPERLLAHAPGAAVLISSDAHEEAIWARSEPLRARGVRVVRMYAEEATAAWAASA